MCSCGLHILQALSTAAHRAPPLLHGEICSTTYQWATGGWPAPPWASPGLQGAAAACLEHLLSLCTHLGACRAAALILLTPLPSPSCCCAAVFPFLNLLSQRCSQYHSLSQLLQWWVPFGAFWNNCLHPTWDSFWALLRGPPCSYQQHRISVVVLAHLLRCIYSEPLCTPSLFTWGVVQETEDLHTVQTLCSSK